MVEITLEEDGKLVLPQAVLQEVELVPGDLLTLAASRTVALVRVYREILAWDWQALPPEERWRDLEIYLRQPMTAVEEGGVVAISEEVFPLRKGDRIALHVFCYDQRHEILIQQPWSARRAEPNP